MLGKLRISFGLYVTAGAAGHIVYNNRCRNAVGKIGVVLNKPGLRRFVVIRRYHQKTVYADFFRFIGKVQSVSCVVAAGARDNGDTVCNGFHGKANRFGVFLMGKRGAFTGRAANDDCVRAVCNLIFQNGFQSGVVDFAFFGERRDNRNTGACKNRLFHQNNLLKINPYTP